MRDRLRHWNRWSQLKRDASDSGTRLLAARLNLRRSCTAKGYRMATKAKTKVSRDAERKSNRSQTGSGRSRAQTPGGDAFEVLERDHREVDEYDGMQGKEDRKEELAQKICLALVGSSPECRSRPVIANRFAKSPRQSSCSLQLLPVALRPADHATQLRNGPKSKWVKPRPGYMPVPP